MRGRLGLRVATTTRTAREARTANAGPTAPNVRRAESSSRSAMSPRTAPGPSPTACVTWLDPPIAASRPTSSDRRGDARHHERRNASNVEPHAARAYEQGRVRGEQHEQPTAVRPEAAARDGDEREPRNRDAEAPEERRSEDRRDEEHRLEQVGDAVEPPCLGRAERRQGDRLRVQPEDEEVREQDRRAREPERKHGGSQRHDRDHPPACEPEVRRKAEQHDAAARGPVRARRRCTRDRRAAGSAGGGCGRSARSGAPGARRVATGSCTATTSSLPCATSESETRPSIRVELEVRTPRCPGVTAIG